MTATFNPSTFTAAHAKPLPLILLLDTSGSMSGPKISALNDAVRKMVGTLKKEESSASEFLISVITFGGDARLVCPPTTSTRFQFQQLTAGGGTPLGAALDVATNLIEDREMTPSRAYCPLVILVSDGVPTDSWKDRLDQFVSAGRTSKCDRMALGIGPEAVGTLGRPTLEKFVEGTEHKIFSVSDAEKIHDFFRFVTMSVTTRIKSQNPNSIPSDHSLAPPRSREETVDPGVPQQPAEDDDEGSYW